MNYWRMAMRDGSRGADMFPVCRDRGIAAITYGPISDIDLIPFSRSHKPPQWKAQKDFSPGSMGHFAFDIAYGDVIFVKDSVGRGIVACGVVEGGASGSRAYRFERDNPVVPPSGLPWRHYVNVSWMPDFEPIPHVARAAIIAVLKLNADEIRLFSKGIDRLAHQQHETTTQGLADKLLETRYIRRSREQIVEIVPLHKMLSNEFVTWAKRQGADELHQEAFYVDTIFLYGKSRLMVEYKICYGGNTAAAIREALGQIFEYNLRRGRHRHDKWLLVLDCPPFSEDIEFVQRLRAEHLAPLFLGWKVSKNSFHFEPDWR
jgi:hypothetical protein